MKSLVNLAFNSLARDDKLLVVQNYQHLFEPHELSLMALRAKCQSLDQLNFGLSEYEIAVGMVQSGKTFEMLCYSWYSINVMKSSVIYVLRNATPDQLQLIQRVTEFNQQDYLIEQPMNIITLHESDEKVIEAIKGGKTIVSCLANYVQVRRLERIIRESGLSLNFNLCIDEVDFTVKTKDGSGSSLETCFGPLKEKAKHIFGVTATPMALFFTQQKPDRYISLKPAKYYKGLDKLVPKILRKTKFGYRQVYSEFLEQKSGILLHTTSTYNKEQEHIFNTLYKEYPDITYVLFNGKRIAIRYPNNKIIDWKKSKSISKILQFLKDDTFRHTHISIICGFLASRGVSFVSEDYEWHLTDQYLVLSATTHGERMIQSLRILGCYRDDLKLRLWCSEDLWISIVDQYNRIVECIKKRKYTNLPTSDRPKRPPTRSKILHGTRLTHDNGKYVYVDIPEEKE